MDGTWALHVANEAIDDGWIDVLEELMINTKVFTWTHSRIGCCLPTEQRLGCVDWPVNPPQRTQEYPHWTGNQFFMKRAIEGERNHGLLSCGFVILKERGLWKDMPCMS